MPEAEKFSLARRERRGGPLSKMVQKAGVNGCFESLKRQPMPTSNIASTICGSTQATRSLSKVGRLPFRSSNTYIKTRFGLV